MDKYLGWESLEEVKRAFFGGYEPDVFPSDDEIVVAWYDTEVYSGRAFVLFKRGGKLFEVNASHCSCNDLEGQWRPEKTSVSALKMRRPTAFPFCNEYDDLYEELVELLDSLTKEKIDPLHPNGRCRCAGEGQCEWCQRTEARDELDGIAEVLDAAGVPQVTDGPDGRRWTLGLGARVEHVIAERDEARAEVEELRAKTSRQLEIECRARDAARAEVERLRALPSAEDLEERAHEILDGAGIPTHALDPLSGEEDYRAGLEERLEWTVEEITRLRRALEPFARFGAAVLLVDGGSGKWHSIRVEGHEHTISLEDFSRARAALAGEGEAKRCAWTYDETHCAWDSSCGEKWILEDGGPNENRIRFCHGCGKPVEVACEATTEKARQGERR